MFSRDKGQALKQHLENHQFTETFSRCCFSFHAASPPVKRRSPSVGREAPQRTAKQASAATNLTHLTQRSVKSYPFPAQVQPS